MLATIVGMRIIQIRMILMEIALRSPNHMLGIHIAATPATNAQATQTKYGREHAVAEYLTLIQIMMAHQTA
jgi:hypothetical protein